jgi:type II secretory pathway pseudopilin PulG
MDNRSRKESIEYHPTRSEKGLTLVELLVGLLLSSVVLFGAMKQYLVGVHIARDNQIRIAAMLQAQAVVQNVGFELRTLGNGVPFDQANFQIGDIRLSNPTVSEPISVATSTADSITFRVNETGDVFLVTQNFIPFINREVFLTDITTLQVGDPIYISNSVVAGNDGLFGVIESVDQGNKSVTIANGYITTAGTTFNTGSVLEEVPLVTYAYEPVTNEVVRQSGNADPVVIARNAQIEFEYLDPDMNTITLPLDNTKVVNQLRAVRVTVRVTSDNTLHSTKEPYTSTASQVFGLRNLNYLF